MPRHVMICLAALLAGCTSIPEIDSEAGAVAGDAEYPRLLPLEQILDSPGASQAGSGETRP